MAVIQGHVADTAYGSDKMNKLQFLRVFGVLLGCLWLTNAALAQNSRPNVVLIVADDLGFSDIGAYGSEIPTPNLDALSSSGARFTNFHALQTCAPSRSVLLTGTENHIAGFGSQLPSEKQKKHPGYQGLLSGNVRTIPEVLRKAGYRNYFAGKWHVGDKKGSLPIDRGFDESFAMMQGGGSHYSDALPLTPHETVVYRRNGDVVEDLPEDFYSTRYFTDRMLGWLERDQGSDQPFFASVSFTAPHDPLHAPAEYIAKYKGLYDDGYQELQQQRFKNLQSFGLISADHMLPPWPSTIAEWGSLSEEEKAQSARDMEIYAAMIDYMDNQIGLIFQWLKDSGEYENTLIIFLSDNGANGLNHTLYEWTDEFAAQFDNSLDNRGLLGSFVSLNAGWATASTAAFKYFKVFSTEGGLRVPAIIKLPNSMQTGVTRGDNIDAFVHIRDVMPTILEVANAEHPSVKNAEIKHLRGKSLFPLLRGDKDRIYSDQEGIGYELHGTRAYIQGDWKILQSPMPIGDGRWELYNISDDPAETTDLSREFPEKRSELVEKHKIYERENGVIYDFVLVVAQAKKLHDFILVLMASLGTVALIGVVSDRYRQAYRRENGPNRLWFGLLTVVQLFGTVLLLSENYRVGIYLLGGALLLKLHLLINKRARWWCYLAWGLMVLSVIIFGLLTSGIGVRAIID